MVPENVLNATNSYLVYGEWIQILGLHIDYSALDYNQ
jgi:hypothetical protein